MEGEGWTDAEDLQLGDNIRNADPSTGLHRPDVLSGGQAFSTGEVESIEFEQTSQEMYNLTVDEAHTFFVGDGQWLVHNVECDPTELLPPGYTGPANGWPNRYSQYEWNLGYKGKLLEDLIADKSNLAPLTKQQLTLRRLFDEKLTVDDPSFIYAIDKKGNIWAAKYGSMHHSSLVNGENVYGAGEMYINQKGVITRVNGWSGHYRPYTRYQEAFFPYLKNLLTEKGILFNEDAFRLHWR